jgi:flagellar biosynthesis protein
MQIKRLRPTNRPRAVALGYDAEKDEAPRVLASGEGKVAEKIIALAQANGIPIRNDPALAAALATVDLDATIPPELYTVVAEVLAFVYRVRQKKVQAAR